MAISDQNNNDLNLVTLTEDEKAIISNYHEDHPLQIKLGAGELEGFPNHIAVYFVNDQIWLQNKQGEINAGGFGSVRMVQNMNTNELQMLKIYKPKQNVEDTAFKQNERAVLSKATHDTLQGLGQQSAHFMRAGAGKDKKNLGKPKDVDKYYVMMPYVKGVSLANVTSIVDTSKFTIAARDKFAMNLVSAVEQFHATGRVHGDLNPTNVVVKDQKGAVELIDFDSASIIDAQTGKATPPGTLIQFEGYKAPELSSYYTEQTDIYALGQMLRTLVGSAIFDTHPVLSNMIAQNPADRPSLAEVKASLQVKFKKECPNPAVKAKTAKYYKWEIQGIETEIEKKHKKILGKDDSPARKRTGFVVKRTVRPDVDPKRELPPKSDLPSKPPSFRT